MFYIINVINNFAQSIHVLSAFVIVAIPCSLLLIGAVFFFTMSPINEEEHSKCFKHYFNVWWKISRV